MHWSRAKNLNMKGTGRRIPIICIGNGKGSGKEGDREKFKRKIYLSQFIISKPCKKLSPYPGPLVEGTLKLLYDQIFSPMIIVDGLQDLRLPVMNIAIMKLSGTR